MLYVCTVMAITHKGYYRNTELVPSPRFHSPELQLTNTIAEREREISPRKIPWPSWESTNLDGKL